MRFAKFGFFGSLIVLAFSGKADAQLLRVNSVDYALTAFAAVGDVSYYEGFLATGASPSFIRTATASIDGSNDIDGYNTASSAASVNVDFVDGGSSAKLASGVGAMAEAFNEGRETQSSATASMVVDFDITTMVQANADSSGTYESNLFRWEGNSWQPFMYGIVGPEQFQMSAGRYRWAGSVGEWVSGTNYYSSGIFFTLEVQAVPEPTSLAVLGLGGLALLRRRRIR